ncbi:MAG: hemagglutinin [Gammaproteobacteria bacterium]|nr:hemagglutinin [Gammaproteobacteria bacterium]MYF60046.1 hemagglutinin [Gammaproteobacteria bacterium]
MNEEFEALEKRVKELEKRMDDVDEKFDKLGENIAKAFKKVFWGDDYWVGMAEQMKNLGRIVELLEELNQKNNKD